MGRRQRKRKHRVVYVASAVTAGLALAGSSHHHHHGGAGAVPESMAAAPIPSGGSYTPRSWARELLRIDNLRRTTCTVNAIVAWEGAEGDMGAGHWGWHNPLNTTYDGPGHSWERNGKVTATENSDGVRAYDSWTDGLRATRDTLKNGLYGGILAALHAGNDAQSVADDAQSVADAVSASPWGTGSFTAAC